MSEEFNFLTILIANPNNLHKKNFDLFHAKKLKQKYDFEIFYIENLEHFKQLFD